MKHSLSSPKKFIIIVSGPTGVGKTDFVLRLADSFPLEIINADVGQLYTPLTIGTAKPDWRHERVPHHLFDVLTTPQSLTVIQYRNLVLPLIEQCWQRNTIPVIVGGSLFYIQSLLFPPQEYTTSDVQHEKGFSLKDDIWQQLFEIDPERAQAIHPHDIYRLQRALQIWHETGVKPSLKKPIYDPIAPYLFVYCTRERNNLYARINERVATMIDAGWLEETKLLLGTPWQDFLLAKKIIGYDDIVHYLLNNSHDKALLIDLIAQKTRKYAKRQETFWRRLSEKLSEYVSPQPLKLPKITTLDLTLLDHDLYIKQLSFLITNLNKESESF
jgi:tRNA dimethylallyltransferase